MKLRNKLIPRDNLIYDNYKLILECQDVQIEYLESWLLQKNIPFKRYIYDEGAIYIGGGFSFSFRKIKGGLTLIMEATPKTYSSMFASGLELILPIAHLE